MTAAPDTTRILAVKLRGAQEVEVDSYNDARRIMRGAKADGVPATTLRRNGRRGLLGYRVFLVSSHGGEARRLLTRLGFSVKPRSEGWSY